VKSASLLAKVRRFALTLSVVAGTDSTRPSDRKRVDFQKAMPLRLLVTWRSLVVVAILTAIATPACADSSGTPSEAEAARTADSGRPTPILLIVEVSAAVLAAAGLVMLVRRQASRQISEQRELLRRELDLEAEHRDLIENANDVIFTLDRENRIASFNRAGERLTGLLRQDVIGCQLHELSGIAAEPGAIGRGAGGSQTFEMPVRKRDGRIMIWEVSARPARRNGVLAVTNCIARDVTERKRAQDELRRLYVMQAQQFEHLPLAFIEWDSQFRVVRWSRQAERIFGWTAEEATGKSCDELNLIDASDADSLRATLQGLVDGQTCNTCRNRNNTKSGANVHVEWYNSALRDDSGRLQCVMSMAHDVTARERDEEERRRLEGQIRQSQKMEAVGLLAGGVAHDFNNLLTVISGCSELLLHEIRPGDPLRELAGEIRQAGEQAATLTRQLLAFSRRQITAPRAIDLNDVVRDVEKLLRRLIGEHIVLGVSLIPSGARVKADPGLMVQMLMNLAVNARDAMPQGGSLTLRTALRDERVVLTVADTGIGMDAATKARIFEPFFTTKPVGEGTGIGLATVHGIVEQSDGEIAVDSEPGRGTTFRIELPICIDRPAAKTTAYVRRTELRPRETILLVEDEDMVRTLAQRVLESRGYRVFAAPSGDDALELHERIPGHVDLLVTDVLMPGMGGRQLAERLQELQPDLRVLFMSGYTTDEVLRQGIQAEEVHFLQKPFTPDGLLRKARDVLSQPVERALATA
jgi:two-component system, cell cycle sensor histidine kinase and response regulator CckA